MALLACFGSPQILDLWTVECGLKKIKFCPAVSSLMVMIEMQPQRGLIFALISRFFHGALEKASWRS